MSYFYFIIKLLFFKERMALFNLDFRSLLLVALVILILALVVIALVTLFQKVAPTCIKRRRGRRSLIQINVTSLKKCSFNLNLHLDIPCMMTPRYVSTCVHL